MHLSPIALLVALTLTAPPPGGESASESADYRGALADARRCVATADLTCAADSYGRALAARPEDAVAMSGRGYARMLAGRYGEAIRDLRRAQTWAKTERERKMVAHNLRLAEAGDRCGIYVDRSRVHGRSGATPGAAIAGPADATPGCEDGRAAPTPLVLRDEEAPLDAFVVMKRADGAWVASPRLASGLGGRCGVFPEVRVTSRDPLIVRVIEEYQDMEWDEDVGTSCWTSRRDVRDILLDPVTLDVLLVVGRHHDRSDEDGESRFDGAAFHVEACGQARTVRLRDPERR